MHHVLSGGRSLAAMLVLCLLPGVATAADPPETPDIGQELEPASGVADAQAVVPRSRAKTNQGCCRILGRVSVVITNHTCQRNRG